MKDNTILTREQHQAWNKALAHLRGQRFGLASKAFEALARNGVRRGEAWFYAGYALEQQGRPQAATVCYRRAAGGFEATPASLPFLCQTGFALLRADAWTEAGSCFDRALDIAPQHPDALMGQGIRMLQSGDCDGAVERFRRANALAPDNPLLIANLIQALVCAGFLEEAHAVIGTAQTAGNSVLLSQYARVLAFEGLFADAERALEALHRADPAAFDSIFAENCAAEVTGRATLDTARYDKTNVAALYAGWHMEQMAHCQWRQHGTFLPRIREMVETALAAGTPPPMAAHLAAFLPFPESLCTALAQSRSVFLADHVARSGPLPKWVYPPLEGRMRIGYVSGDIRDHATAHLIRSLMGCHDRERVEVFVYALVKSDGSQYADKIRRECDHFVDFSDVSNREAAQRIHDNGIHVLVDLHGHTRYARLEIFALRPAPVQVTWLGFPGSVGADYIPYALVDAVVAPPGSESQLNETLVILPECYQVNDRWQPVASAVPTRAQEGLPEKGFVFACFNGARKIEPEVFGCWMDILKRTPDSVLWLYRSSDRMVFNLRREAQALGVDPDRLVFAPHKMKAAHLGRLQLADLFLDTFICRAHTTASDSLWAGVPVLTFPGDRFASRSPASLLYAVGLADMVMPSKLAYLERAVDLASKPEPLASIRQRLADNRMVYPLFDTQRFARHLEDAYQLMWEAHEADKRPSRIEVPVRKDRELEK